MSRDQKCNANALSCVPAAKVEINDIFADIDYIYQVQERKPVSEVTPEERQRGNKQAPPSGISYHMYEKDSNWTSRRERVWDWMGSATLTC